MSQLSRRFSLCLALVTPLVISGCAGQSYSRYTNSPISATPAPGHARVYFVMSQGFPKGRGFVLQEDKLIAVLTNRQYTLVDVPAGEHLFMLVSEQTKGLSGNFEAGKTYHVKMYVTPGLMKSQVSWTPLNSSAEGLEKRQKGLAASTRVELDPSRATQWENKYAEKNRTRVSNFRSGQAKATQITPEDGA